MTQSLKYSFGVKGQPWGSEEKAQWFAMQSIKRSYQVEVLNKLEPLKAYFNVTEYGALSIDKTRYPLFAFKTADWNPNKRTVLVTGGVHGYETSGVQGAIRFLEKLSANPDGYEGFNYIVVPCVSPWGYETINRWNDKAIDPNRSFCDNSPAQESALLMSFIASLKTQFDNTPYESIYCHIDLHETTDTDNSEFRPALSARDAIEQKVWSIPDGFYLVGNSTNPQPEFQKAIINGVEKVTHIAPATDGKLIGVPIEQFGVINYEGRKLGLCMGLTDAKYVTTTEVYPDSPRSDDENCILAQVAVIEGAISYLLTLD
ncbi:MAG: M14 family metallopeptidase [Colwellia sp.]